MNEAAQKYWNGFWKNRGAQPKVDAWQFGVDADELARLVAAGIKTATCSGHVFYEIEKEPLPEVGEYNIILNSKDEPVCITKTTDVTVMPMNEVPEELAIAEGEGDRTYDYWWKAHEAFFKEELRGIGRDFSEDMPLVCERFTVVDVRK